MTTLGELLAIAREMKGWTLRDLEEKTGISNAAISQIETGHIKQPGFFRVMRIAGALNVSVERLKNVDELK